MTVPRPTGVASAESAGRSLAGLSAAALGLGAVALAVGIRVRLAGVDGARSVPAGIAVGVALILVAGALGLDRPTMGRRQWRWGVGGAVALCVVPVGRAWLGHRLGAAATGAAPADLTRWAVVVTLVAVAEEAVLRGAVFEALTRFRDENTAIAVTAVAFALMHVPVYGWSVLPLDLAVGVALGVLRVLAGSVSAPAIAHVLADLAGWWLR